MPLDALVDHAYFTDTYLPMVQAKLNAAFVQRGHPGLQIHLVPNNRENRRLYKELLRDPYVRRLIDEGESAPGYALFESKLDVIADAIVAMYLNGMDNIAIHADTQWGKTIVMVMLNLLMQNYSAVKALQENDTQPREAFITVIIGRNSPEMTTKRDYEAARRIHAPLTFDETGDEDLDSTAKLVSTVTVKKTPSGLRELGVALGQLKADGYTSVTLFVDEADEALGNDTIYSKILDAIKTAELSGRVVMISATGYAYSGLKSFYHILAPITNDEGYSGTVAGIQTPIMTLTEYGQLYAPGVQDIRPSWYRGIGVFQKWKTGYRRGLKQARKMAAGLVDVGAVLKMSHAHYRAHCEAAILTLVRSEVKNTPRHRFGPFGGGRGALLRFGASSQIMTDMLDAIESDCKKLGVSIVRFYDRTHSASGARVVLNENARHDVENALSLGVREALNTYPFCIVAVMQAGRRADRLPRCITRGWDFTEAFSTMEATEQGTLGRLSGYGKITDVQETLILLSEPNAKAIDKFREYYNRFKCKVPIKQVKRTTRVVGMIMRSTDRLVIDLRDVNLPHRLALWKWVKDRIIPHLEHDADNLTMKRSRAAQEIMSQSDGIRIHRDKTKRGLGMPVFDLFDALTQPVLADILRYLGFTDDAKVVVPWSPAAKGKLMMDQGWVPVTISNLNSGKGEIAGAGSMNATARNKITSEGAKLGGSMRPEIRLDYSKNAKPVGKGLILLQLTEKTLQAVNDVDGEDPEDFVIVLPDEKSYLWENFMAEDERERVKAQRRLREIRLAKPRKGAAARSAVAGRPTA